jgi:hypothetical protein
MTRKAFYSFHYKPDNWRAATVRNIGAIEGNKPTTDNDWETIARGGDDAIKRWIATQMQGRTCAVVLVGTNTANRKWINYEIVKAWDDGLGVVGIHIHGLKDSAQATSTKLSTWQMPSKRLSRFAQITRPIVPPPAGSRERPRRRPCIFLYENAGRKGLTAWAVI